MSADLTVEVLLTCVYVLVPGCGVCLATQAAVGRSAWTFLALAFGVGFAFTGGLCLLLALLGVLRPGILLVAWAAGSTIPLTIAVRRGSFSRSWAGWRGDAVRDPWTTLSTTVLVIGVAIARSIVPPATAIAPTVLRYWSDGLEVADAGRIPEATLQWGTLLPPVTSKVVLNAFNAGASMLLGREVVPSQAALLLVVTVGLVVIATALLSELGMPRLAPLGALVLFANAVAPNDLSADLSRNLAENWGRLASFAAVLACVLALRSTSDTSGSDPRRRLPLIVMSGALLGISAATHLVAASFGIGAICSIVLARSILVGWKRSSLMAVGAMIGLALGVGATIVVLAPGDLGFTGAVGADPYRELRTDLNLPPTFDPTRFITTHDVEAALRVEPVRLSDVAEAFASKSDASNVLRAMRDEGPSPLLLALPTIAALLLAVGAFLLGPTSLRITVLSAVIIGVTLFAVGAAFAVRYDQFVLASFGNRRLFSYAVIAHVLVIAAAGEACVIRLLARRRASLVSIVVAATVVALTVAALPRIVTRVGSDEPWASQLALVEWVGRHVPCEGRVLADRRTLGTFEAIAGRAGVLEGMGPHIRPAVLELAIREIFRARTFFDDPDAGLPFLRERGVAAIVVTRPSPRPGFIGYPIARVRPGRLDRVPYLRPGFRNAAGTVYLVEGPADPVSPRVGALPGYCP